MVYDKFYINISIYIVLLVLILFVLHNYYYVIKCRIFTEVDIKSQKKEELKTEDNILYYIESKNILGLILFIQWGLYTTTFLMFNSKNEIFGLIIPLLYTYIFENMYSIIANEKRIPSEIQKDDLHGVKATNIFLMTLFIIRATAYGSVKLVPSSDNLYDQYLNYCFVAMISYVIGYITMRVTLK